jgi:hypothetical protein
MHNRFMLGHPVGNYKVPMLALVRQEKLSLVFTFQFRACYSYIADPGMGQDSNGADREASTSRHEPTVDRGIERSPALEVSQSLS